MNLVIHTSLLVNESGLTIPNASKIEWGSVVTHYNNEVYLRASGMTLGKRDYLAYSSTSRNVYKDYISNDILTLTLNGGSSYSWTIYYSYWAV